MDESRIRCGIRELEKDPFEFSFSEKKIGDIVTATIDAVIPKEGILVYVGNPECSLLLQEWNIIS